jgi:hypothetical protein
MRNMETTNIEYRTMNSECRSVKLEAVNFIIRHFMFDIHDS